jgi:uncharacterized repeat protein (TIGR01451 family)
VFPKLGWFTCPCDKPFDFTVCADYYNVVDESNESNNCETNHEYCGIEGMTVEKKVRHAGTSTWYDTIDAEHCDMVEFEGTVNNTGCCCNLTNIKVTDVLSPSLEYEDGSATPTPDSVFYNATDGTTTLTWTTPLLKYCEETTYGITAHVIGCGEHGLDRNTITANATTCTGKEIDGSDYAEVYAPPKAKVNVTKKVKDPVTGQWVDSIIVANGTDVQFNCTVHNEGTCHDLMYITVWDTLSASLEYKSAVGPNGQQPIVQGGQPGNPTVLEWYIPNIILKPCETLEFYINVTATTGGEGYCVDTNTQSATAWSVERGTPYGQWVTDTDQATVELFKTVELVEKNTTDWSTVPFGNFGVLEYCIDTTGLLKYDFVLVDSDTLTGLHDLVVIAPELGGGSGWPQTGSMALTGHLGTADISGLLGWVNDGADYDGSVYGAKIWYVPTVDFDGTAFTAWNPGNILFEDKLITP